MYKKILLAVDDSPNSLRAVERVAELQNYWNCKVIMIHSIKHPTNMALESVTFPSGGGLYYVSELELLYHAKVEGERLLSRMTEKFHEKNLNVETRIITEEHPNEYIERAVKEEHIDLVVIGTKGVHSKIRKIIIGSIAQKVVKHTPCDVLIIR
ncbi:MAG: universal stress protein [Promethearchaeota archaeon]